MCSNLRLMDFSLKTGSPPVNVGSKTFHQALWGAQHVTLMFNTGISTSSALNLGTFNLHSVTDFSDLVPCEYCPNEKQNKKQIQGVYIVVNLIEFELMMTLLQPQFLSCLGFKFTPYNHTVNT